MGASRQSRWDTYQQVSAAVSGPTAGPGSSAEFGGISWPLEQKPHKMRNIRGGCPALIGLRGGARSHKAKNPGDYIASSGICCQCDTQVFYILSLRRHLEKKHKLDADTAAAECEQLMRDTLRYDAEEVKGDKRCLVDGCIAQFRSEASRVNHIRVVHSMDVAKADMTRPKPMKDTCDELIRCPHCPQDIEQIWTRRARLLRHLKSKAHYLSDVTAKTIVYRSAAEVPAAKDYDDDNDQPLLDNHDNVQHVDMVNLADIVYGDDHVNESPCGRANSLLFLDKY